MYIVKCSPTHPSQIFGILIVGSVPLNRTILRLGHKCRVKRKYIMLNTLELRDPKGARVVVCIVAGIPAELD